MRRLDNGAVVTIFGVGPEGPHIEGRAIVRGPCRDANSYRVVFAGEKISCTRFVHPDWQHDPERSLRLLREFWQATLAPPAIDEFFPKNRVGRGGAHGGRIISHARY